MLRLHLPFGREVSENVSLCSDRRCSGCCISLVLVLLSFLSLFLVVLGQKLTRSGRESQACGIQGSLRRIALFLPRQSAQIRKAHVTLTQLRRTCLSAYLQRCVLFPHRRFSMIGLLWFVYFNAKRHSVEPHPKIVLEKDVK